MKLTMNKSTWLSICESQMQTTSAVVDALDPGHEVTFDPMKCPGLTEHELIVEIEIDDAVMLRAYKFATKVAIALNPIIKLVVASADSLAAEFNKLIKELK